MLSSARTHRNEKTILKCSYLECANLTMIPDDILKKQIDFQKRYLHYSI